MVCAGVVEESSGKIAGNIFQQLRFGVFSRGGFRGNACIGGAISERNFCEICRRKSAQNTEKHKTKLCAEVPERPLPKDPSFQLLNFPESRHALNSRILGSGKGKPAANIGSTLPWPCADPPRGFAVRSGSNRHRFAAISNRTIRIARPKNGSNGRSLSFFSLVFVFPWCFSSCGNPWSFGVFSAYFPRFLRVRGVRRILGVFEVFLGIFEKTKEKKDRVKIGFKSRDSIH